MELSLKQRLILNEYYENEAKKLHDVVDKVLKQLKFYDIDKDDFYSLANEIFFGVIQRYEESQSFDGFLYSSLYKKFCTEMTRRNRQKRKAVMQISLDQPLHEEEGDAKTLMDVISETRIATDFDIEKTFFEDEGGERFSEKMLLYISRLSNLQKEVVKLIVAGFHKDEIKEILHIDNNQYKDCIASIGSYKNISILF